jgi:hypothetical protein
MQRQRPFAKKSLGQHFLADLAAVEDMAAALDLRPGHQVLEIGAGRGVLTRRLVELGAQVVAVELDADLVPELATLPIQILQHDVLSLDVGQVFGGPPYKVVGNIPYYISSPILRRVLEASPKPERVVLMLQRELAERVVAPPGDMSLLSVSVQVYGRAELLRVVPARFQTASQGRFGHRPNRRLPRAGRSNARSRAILRHRPGWLFGAPQAAAQCPATELQASRSAHAGKPRLRGGVERLARRGDRSH